MKFDQLKTVLVVCAVIIGLIAWFAPKPGADKAPATGGAVAKRGATASPAAAPPNPYRYAGRMTQQGETQILLAKRAAGNTTVAARPGTVLDGIYRIDEVTPTAVVMTYLPLAVKQVVAIDPPQAPVTVPGASIEAANSETRLPPPISGLSSSLPAATPEPPPPAQSPAPSSNAQR